MATVTSVNFTRFFAGLRSTRRKTRATGYLREQVARFNAVDPESVKIDRKVNEYIMTNIITRGGTLKISVNKNAGIVEVKLAEEKKAPEKASTAATLAKPAAKESKPAGVVPEKKEATKPAAPAPKADAKKPAERPAKV